MFSFFAAAAVEILNQRYFQLSEFLRGKQNFYVEFFRSAANATIIYFFIAVEI